MILITLYFVNPKLYSQKFGDALTFGTRVTGDFVVNASGGIKKGYTYMGLEDFTISLNSGAAGWWENGTFFLHGLNMHGRGASETLTGDLQVLSNIEAGDYTGLYELYYMHEFEKLTFLTGLHDLNSEFAGTKYGGTFLNSSFGVVPSISLNMPVSIYPVAAPCFFFKYTPSEIWNFKTAIYDGNPGDFETNRYNLHWKINSKEGFFSILQSEYSRIRWEQLTGTYKFGIYYHSGNFLNYRDTTKYHKGNYGVYFVIDQALFNRSLHAGKGLCFFIQGGITPDEFNQVSTYFGGGLRYHGLLSNRFYDEIGIAVASIIGGKYYQKMDLFSKVSETSIEGTYKFVFQKKYTIQPCSQYIINPSFGNYDNSWVFMLRFSLEY